MLRVNQKKLENKKVKNKPGYNSNESRFGGYEYELRKHKILHIPSYTSAMITIEQGWNQKAQSKDALKLICKDGDKKIVLILERGELEQALSFFAQGMELVKYVQPKITNNSKYAIPRGADSFK